MLIMRIKTYQMMCCSESRMRELGDGCMSARIHMCCHQRFHCVLPNEPHNNDSAVESKEFLVSVSKDPIAPMDILK